MLSQIAADLLLIGLSVSPLLPYWNLGLRRECVRGDELMQRKTCSAAKLDGLVDALARESTAVNWML